MKEIFVQPYHRGDPPYSRLDWHADKRADLSGVFCGRKSRKCTGDCTDVWDRILFPCGAGEIYGTVCSRTSGKWFSGRGSDFNDGYGFCDGQLEKPFYNSSSCLHAAYFVYACEPTVAYSILLPAMSGVAVFLSGVGLVAYRVFQSDIERMEV